MGNLVGDEMGLLRNMARRLALSDPVRLPSDEATP